MSSYEQDYEPLKDSKIDGWLAEGYSRYYIHNIKNDIEEAVGTIDVYLRHYVQVPPLAGHLHKVEGMHLVMSLYNKLKEWQLKRRQMRDTFSDNCMNEKDCQHALGQLHAISIKVTERLKFIKDNYPKTYIEDRTASVESAALSSKEIQDYEEWCKDPNYDPSGNPWVHPYIMKPFANGVFEVPDLDKYKEEYDDSEFLSASEDNHIDNPGDYRTIREASSQISMDDIYTHLYRVIYAINTCFIGILQDDKLIRMGEKIPIEIASLSVYRNYSVELLTSLSNTQEWQKEQGKAISKELSDWCETNEYSKKNLSKNQEIEFYKFIIKRYKGIIEDRYPSYNAIRKEFIASDNSVNIPALAQKVYHENGADDFLKKCLIIDYARLKSKEIKQTNQKQKKNSRTSPTYALTPFGHEKESVAKACAKRAYNHNWGEGYMNAYLIRALKEKLIIKDLKPQAAVRLLMHWELFNGDEKTIADNIGNKLNKIKAKKPELWDVPDEEIIFYNEILTEFEADFPSAID